MPLVLHVQNAASVRKVISVEQLGPRVDFNDCKDGAIQANCGCRATGATALVKLGAPQPDELGFAKSLALEEIGGTNVVVLQQDASQGQVCTRSSCWVSCTVFP